MKTEIIAVGTELLMGYVVDTNSGAIARELLTIGIGTYYQQTVGDNPKRMKNALELASKRSNLIILTGGLGPTQDDITKEVVADFVKDELVLDGEQLDKILEEFKKRDRTPDEKVYQEALTFKNGQTLINNVGLACGAAFEMKKEGKISQHVILLPGVPYEMEVMLKNEVMPYLKKHVQTDGVIESLFMNFNNIGESKVATLLNERIDEQTNPTIAMYAKPRHITIRLTANAADSKTAKQMNQDTADEILKKLSAYFIGYGEDQTIESHVAELLKNEKLTLSVIEGFTSGLVMSALTGIPGVSSIFLGGLISLTHQTSEAQFDLSDLESKSDEEVAVLLAEQCKEKFQSDIGLSIDAVTTVNPSNQLMSGKAFIAVAKKGDETQVKTFSLPEKPKHVLREIIKNEALAFLKEIVA